MATSFLKKTMVYLGLVDDEYDDDYADLDDPGPRGFSPRVEPRVAHPDDSFASTTAVPSGRIRTLAREPATNGSTINATPSSPRVSAPAPVRPMTPDSPRSPVIVQPRNFGDAAKIGEYAKEGCPVIVNLQNAERDLQRRMIDFSSGLIFALAGKMERVAEDVFLLTPPNTRVSDEERLRLQERGLVRP